MIERLQGIARRLLRIRWLIGVLAAASLGLFVFSLMGPAAGADDVLMMPAIVAFCWSALMLSYAFLFTRIPPRPDSSHSWLRRLKLRFLRGLVGLLAFVMLGLTLGVLIVSYQLLRLFITS